MTTPRSVAEALARVIATPVSFWAAARLTVSVWDVYPDLLTTSVNEAGVGRPRNVNDPACAPVSDTVLTRVCPLEATTVAPDRAVEPVETEPLISPSPLTSVICTPVRTSPARTSMRSVDGA